VEDVAQNTSRRPEPARFTDYREYLRALIAHLKATRPQFSYRWFSMRAGFSSPNFLKLVAEGERNLSLASVEKFARGLGLDEEEREVFELLVRLDQAENDEERNRVFARLRRFQARVRTLEADQYDLYSDWHAVVLRELVGLGRFAEEDAATLAKRLRPAVPAAQVKKAIALLERLGMLARGADGLLRQAERKVSTGSEVVSLAVRNFHRSMLSLASRALDATPREERHISALTVPLTRGQYETVQARIAAFRRELLELLDEEADGPRAVHQIQFIVFPVSEEISE
jgi:uncharacterized protein (TIGR02147 family)